MTKTAEQAKPVYAATLYHDSIDEGDDDQRDLGYYPSLKAAVAAINEARTPADSAREGWFTGGVQYGFLHPAVFGRRPERFESDDREQSWFVGIDGKADR
jgi:hypothetical protein